MCNYKAIIHREEDVAEAFFQEPNASHLRRAIADMDAGRNIVFHDIIEDSADA